MRITKAEVMAETTDGSRSRIFKPIRKMRRHINVRSPNALKRCIVHGLASHWFVNIEMKRNIPAD